MIRPGEFEVADRDALSMTVEERLAAVWELTGLCYAWGREAGAEPEFQRNVVRIVRSRR